ncbi:aminotransferase class V-fold PLP-dependent enzyme [Kineosporia sp. J2-2]|uniref:Kynureninase n=1 Tax=Kineosporia corallincola TaxID=2835133 RepID=A0ABS5TG95_9ACTN|nr:aminotransferase class V-fold PLP-dependent enzyme [Kineosporia corallincola]MBT0768624.1 aminotransferase class V-fold PLP-dependent enzyme [Kineosporia corallincola]
MTPSTRPTASTGTETSTGATASTIDDGTDLLSRAAALDAADPLAALRERFVPGDGDLVAYLDGNSLGRPLLATRERLSRFVDEVWAPRLIRGWDEGWMDSPLTLGDTLGRLTLGAAPGQTVVADSTTVMLYKLARAALSARPGRTEIVLDSENFPTDRYVLEGVAAETGTRLVWIDPDPSAGVTADQVAAVTGPQTALVVLSHVAFKSGYLADVPAITDIVHRDGALVLWDLCHSAGVVPVELDDWDVDLAVGCTYKYLNGGPGSPAFGYVARRLQGELRQPVQGWMGHAEPFTMGPGYRPAEGMRRFISGTPPVVGMLAMRDMLELIEEAGLDAVRAKSLALTSYVVEVADRILAPYGVEVSGPREPERRGGHVMLSHPAFRELMPRLWERGVIPDFRPPQGLRVGLSPLSTSFTEVTLGLREVAGLLGDLP